MEPEELIENMKITFTVRIHEDDYDLIEKSLRDWYEFNDIAMCWVSLESEKLGD